jgi:hypothetical protein
MGSQHPGGRDRPQAMYKRLAHALAYARGLGNVQLQWERTRVRACLVGCLCNNMPTSGAREGGTQGDRMLNF